MKKIQVILIIAAIGLTALLYSLPKVVVDNDENDGVAEFVDESTSEPIVEHGVEISEETLSKINYWKSKLLVKGQLNQDETSLDSLMKVFVSNNKYDSAAHYAGMFADAYQEIEHWRKAGDAYFEAFTFALEPAKIQQMSSQARLYYNKILDAGVNDLDAKNNIAMTFIESSSPMQGIMMLRKILEEEPQNQKALYNMGLLSIRSNQFDKGVERFEALVKAYPESLEGNYYLGVCYFETGNLPKAKAQFLKVKGMDTDAMVQTAVDEYLERIN